MKSDPRYTKLLGVLTRAYDQASAGKGAERHGQDLPFEHQPMQTISNLLNTADGMLYQAVKKIQESKRLPPGRDVAELLGAINYLAGAVIWLERAHGSVHANENRPSFGCGITTGCENTACQGAQTCLGVRRSDRA